MLYLLVGRNEFLREEFVSRLKTLMRRLPAGEHNLDEFGSLTPVRDIIATCDAAPFLCEKRMVIARGVCSTGSRQRARARSGGSTLRAPSEAGRGAPVQELAAYVPHLPESTHLVLIEDDAAVLEPMLAAKPDAVKREFNPIRDDALPGWVIERAKVHHARIDPRAAQELALIAGPDLRVLDRELAKLATYVDPDATITVADVRTLVSGSGPSIFDFQDAIAERRPAAALAATRGRLNAGDDPAELLAQAAALVRRLLIVKELRSRGASLARAAAVYGLSTSPYLLQKLERQAARVASADLERAFLVLHQADMAIKTGRREPDLAIELAIAEIVGVGSAE